MGAERDLVVHAPAFAFRFSPDVKFVVLVVLVVLVIGSAHGTPCLIHHSELSREGNGAVRMQ